MILLQRRIETAKKSEKVCSSIIQTGKLENPSALINDHFQYCDPSPDDAIGSVPRDNTYLPEVSFRRSPFYVFFRFQCSGRIDSRFSTRNRFHLECFPITRLSTVDTGAQFPVPGNVCRSYPGGGVGLQGAGIGSGASQAPFDQLSCLCFLQA